MSKRKLAKEDTWQCIEFYIKRYSELTREECQKYARRQAQTTMHYRSRI